MVKEKCHRCGKPVYPTDKVGPLKDCSYFHQGCFKCYICGTRLALKTYCNNRNNIDDQEIYCNNHVPLAGPHDLPPQKATANGKANGHSPVDGQHRNDAGLGDMKIAHAMKATQVAKPYPKILHAGAKYIVDYDTQTRLELVHRGDEDNLYREFSEHRAKEEKEFQRETKEEWERALAELARKQERGQTTEKAQVELLRHLTIKRDKKLETLHHKRKERERMQTAELVDKQAMEMLELFKQARRNGHYNGENGVEPGSDCEQGPPSYPTTPPPPFPPSSRKREVYTDTTVFESIDQTAISVAQSDVASFTELIRTLTLSARCDVDKARAIYRWITVKNLNLMDFDHTIDNNTPMGLLRGIKFGTESYHVLFKRLCSYAGLHCVVIKGYSKSAGYQPGFRFEDSRFRNTWNAVFLDGSWRFVQCNWGARHLVNAKEGPGVGRHASRNGGGRDAKDSSSKNENLRYEYDDHYFMTDPEEFIYEFFPNQPEWQLLKRPLSLRDFEQLPFVRSLFFRYGLSFADPHLLAVVPADSTGAATVAINMSPDAIGSLIFHYNLRFYDGDESEFNGMNLKRFVMQSVVGHSVVFRVHVPCRGSMLLDIFANAVTAGEYLTGQPMKFKSVCKFKIVCDHLNVIMVPLPECASGEWGPAKAYRLFGLIPLTHEDAIVNSGRELEIRFRMSKPLVEFVGNLHKNRMEDRRLNKCVTQTVRGDQIIFRMQFPEEGQYGLDLYTRESGSGRSSSQGKQLLTHSCKYLINVRL
uniref:LIM zinc-binding domain-containing protein n=1 Tax=Plectus sambesii TaxID=2011161 RepID=A0A914W6V1_9BILA